MRAVKDKNIISFIFEDGGNVKYDINTQKTYGKSGKEVVGLQSQLRGCNITEFMDSFEDKNFSNFLKYVYKYGGYDRRSIKNIGTLLKWVDEYYWLEQVFSAGLTNISSDIDVLKNTKIPKGLVKLCKKYPSLKLGNELIFRYNQDSAVFHLIDEMDFLSDKEDMFEAIGGTYKYMHVWDRYNALKNERGYDRKPLLKYIDYLATFEAVSKPIVELEDYANMMGKITDKFDKYPRNFLTAHNIASRTYRRYQEKFDEEAFQKRIDLSLEFSDSIYSVIYPKTTDEIKVEGATMSHCVASYISKVIDGYSHIVFLREKTNLEEPLVTLQIRHNQVVQAKRKHNVDPSPSEYKFIEKYNKYLLEQEK